MHEHLDLLITLLHHGTLRRGVESSLRHQVEKPRRLHAPGIGEEGFAAWREEPGHEIRKGYYAPSLVEHVGGEEEIEGPEAPRLRRVPV